jgi:sugar/nucleoside kinase (ribokinase family)
VVVTRGRDGATAYGADGACHVPARPARQVDTTGAGDAFAVGLITGLLDGRDIRASLELGTAWGAAAVEALQSVPPDWVDGPAPP